MQITDEMTPGTVALPHGWGHRGGWRLANEAGGVNVNLLAPSDPDRSSGSPGMAHLNGIPVRVERVAAAGSGQRCRSRRVERQAVPERLAHLRLPRRSSSMRSARSCELEPPWPPAAERRSPRVTGSRFPRSEARQAMLAEMSYYRAHHREGARRRVARRPAPALRGGAPGAPAAAVVDC